MSPADGHREEDTVREAVTRHRGKVGRPAPGWEYLLGEQSLHRGQVSAIVISLQAVLFLTCTGSETTHQARPGTVTLMLRTPNN